MIRKDVRVPLGPGWPIRRIDFIHDIESPSDPKDGQNNLHRPYEVDGDEYVR